jgi:hypothetical protein
MNIEISENWGFSIYYYKFKWTLGISLERWNDGDDWRLYFLFWEFNLYKLFS